MYTLGLRPTTVLKKFNDIKKKKHKERERERERKERQAETLNINTKLLAPGSLHA